MPEAFVSETSISREVSRAAKAGKLRKLASRLYTRNLTDAPEAIVRRHVWNIVSAAVDWSTVEETRRELEACNAFLDPMVAEEEGKRLKMPGMAAS